MGKLINRVKEYSLHGVFDSLIGPDYGCNNVTETFASQVCFRKMGRVFSERCSNRSPWIVKSTLIWSRLTPVDFTCQGYV